MITQILRRLQRQQELKKNWLAFYAEVNKNLEAYYVMFQLDKLRSFHLDVWKKIKGDTEISFASDVRRYIEILSDYNQTLKSFKDYEQWYVADLGNKIPENGRILHAKKEEAAKKFQGLEEIIKRAQKSVQEQMASLRILKGS